jgi:oligopeptide transport system substrate-binding protein
MKKTLTLVLTLVMIVSLAFGMIACKPAETTAPVATEEAAPAAAVEEPVAAEPTSATVCVGSEPATLDPNMNESVDGMIYIQHLYEGLYRPNTDGSFSLGQAKDITITDNADGTAHVVATLRDDIFWSDGVPVTAQDFVYSWVRLCDPATGSSYGYIGQDFFANGHDVANEVITPDQLSVKAIDDKTLEFDIAANVPYTKDLLAFPSLMPLREDIVEANPEGWSVEVDTQVANGRYVLTSFAHESELVLTKNDAYWEADTTLLDTLKCMLSDDDNAILAAFKAGDLQLADSFPSDELAALRATPEYTQFGQIGLYYLQLQQMEGGAAVLQDVNVRKALSLAIDRDFVNQTVWNSSRIPAYAIVPFGVPDATPGSDFRKTGGDAVGGDMTNDYTANVAKAKELLAAAGYPDGAGFPKLEFSINENTGHQAVAEAIMQMWSENLGITVEIATMDWATFQGYRKTTDSEIARQGWIGDYTDPATFFDLFVSTAGTNDGHYNNAEYDALVIGARTEMDPVKRMDMYHQAETIIMNDMGVIPIVFYADDVLSQVNFTGFGVTGTGLKMFWGATYTD